MAYATEIRAQKAGFAGFFEGLKVRFARQMLIRETIKELNALTSRELADLGLHRSQITGIAIAAANERFGAL
ncbi:DUF1127 domain-containing protein [Donghicola sp. C2-DW-16]|uniref:DUF1127 domain-containing protein n=2 Tax=Donghicola mangrovi TaxID=2729614 RepID=A0ABX2PHW5_9RHOB|nr:DUF1127 domain-containing protein [Donghicola mangrovi]